MKINAMNGQIIPNGTNRIEHVNGTNRIEHVNGTLAEYMNGYTLNGYTLNANTMRALAAMDDEDYQLLKAILAAQSENDDAMNGLSLAALAGIAKKVGGAIKKGVQVVKTGLQTLRDRASGVIETAQEAGARGMEQLDTFQTKISQEAPEQSPERGYMVGKPPFEPWKGKWWNDNQTPTWQKAAVIGGGVLVVDYLTGGKIILQRVGLMKAKKKRK